LLSYPYPYSPRSKSSIDLFAGKKYVAYMWVLPTYDRPERAQETLDSIERCGVNTSGLIYVDGSTNPGYANLRAPKNWSIWKGEKNLGVCRALNAVFSKFPNEPWYGFLSDDSIVKTPNWDQILLSKRDNFSIVHSADGWQSGPRIHGRIHGAVLFGGELLRALGWWVAPGLVHSFCDDVWEAIADAAHLRKFVPEVMVEHCHFGNGKRAIDPSYLKAYHSFDQDKEAFMLWKEKDLSKALRQIAVRQK
jgi:hypothetical protein